MKKTKSSIRISLIEGDGIGPEICAEVRKVAQALRVPLEFETVLIGVQAQKKYGSLLPEASLKILKKNRIALKGPLTTPVGEGYRSLNVQLRQEFELFANLRPVFSFENLSPHLGVDLVIVRENTEDLYSGIEHEVAPGVVESIKVITREASTRIAKFAFEYAVQNRRKKISSIHKANIMKLSDGLFLDCARKVAKKYPQIKYDEVIVDNACMQLVSRPQQFDMLLLENLYGDIVSDLCAGLVGGLGVVPGANLGKKYAIFEAVHGSAPDIAGKGIANPCAILLSFAMLLRYIQESKAAERLETAIRKLLANPKTRTVDLGGKLSTSEMGTKIVENL